MGYRAYPEYKDSGVEWLGRVPADWEVRRLKFVASHNDETLPENTDDQYEIEYVDISSVDLVQGITSTENMPFEKAPSRARRVVRHGDTLVSTVRTYLKAIAAVSNPPDNLIASTGFTVIRANNEIDTGFLACYLQSQGFVDAVVANSTGVSYPAINASDLVCLSVAYPADKKEQAKIAQFLDHKTAQIDRLIEKKQELIEKFQEQRTATITQAVTKGLDSNAGMKDSGVEWLGRVPEHWDIHQLSLLTKTIQTGPFGSQLHASDYVEGGVPLINPAHLVAGSINPEEQSAVDTKTVERLSRHKLRAADIIMARRGEIGRCAFVEEEQAGWLCGTGSLIIRFATGNSRFFSTVISSGGFSKKLELHAVGTTMLNLNPTIIGRMLVPVPPLAEQNQIVSYIDSATKKIDRSITKARETIARLHEYRTALITAAVTGQIDVRDWQAPEPIQESAANKEVA